MIKNIGCILLITIAVGTAYAATANEVAVFDDHVRRNCARISLTGFAERVVSRKPGALTTCKGLSNEPGNTSLSRVDIVGLQSKKWHGLVYKGEQVVHLTANIYHDGTAENPNYSSIIHGDARSLKLDYSNMRNQFKFLSAAVAVVGAAWWAWSWLRR